MDMIMATIFFVVIVTIIAVTAGTRAASGESAVGFRVDGKAPAGGYAPRVD